MSETRDNILAHKFHPNCVVKIIIRTTPSLTSHNTYLDRLDQLCSGIGDILSALDKVSLGNGVLAFLGGTLAGVTQFRCVLGYLSGSS